MPEIVHKSSYGSVKVFWLNKGLLNESLRSIAEKIGRRFVNIKRVILFGSQSEGRATPFSDIDILIILDKVQERFLDRSQPYIEYFQELEMDTDIFVYSEEEFKRSDFAHRPKEGSYEVLYEANCP